MNRVISESRLGIGIIKHKKDFEKNMALQESGFSVPWPEIKQIAIVMWTL